MHIDSFQYSFAASGTTDVGMENRINDDRIVLDTDHGFFAVSDGMGGLRCGNAAASYVAESLPGLMNICLSECSAGIRKAVLTMVPRWQASGCTGSARCLWGSGTAGVICCKKTVTG